MPARLRRGRWEGPFGVKLEPIWWRDVILSRGFLLAWFGRPQPPSLLIPATCCGGKPIRRRVSVGGGEEGLRMDVSHKCKWKLYGYNGFWGFSNEALNRFCGPLFCWLCWMIFSVVVRCYWLRPGRQAGCMWFMMAIIYIYIYPIGKLLPPGHPTWQVGWINRGRPTPGSVLGATAKFR